MTASASTPNEDSVALRWRVLIVLAVTGFSFALYWWSAAPGLTWSHDGADGGDFLTAAVTNGVPHPSGYPLYMLLLQGWLWAGRLVAPSMNLARSGNLFSAAAAALCVGLTLMVGVQVLGRSWRHWLIAIAGTALWAVSPIFWGQALITEVYTLHMALAALLVWAILVYPRKLWLAAVIVALGMANHLTFALLLPAVGYWLWHINRRKLLGRQSLKALVIAVGLCALFYLRIPIVTSRAQPAPVNWGYADNWRGFWWLVSGNAYRVYLADQSLNSIALRITAWARAVALQYTPVGLAVSAIGLASWDRSRPPLRNFSLLWIAPVSLYAIVYGTHDSYVYLLPVMWMMALWIMAGMDAIVDWICRRRPYNPTRVSALVGGVALLFALSLAVYSMPQQSLRNDQQAMLWLDGVYESVEPNSIIVSSSDNETFALWYATWVTGELLELAPGAVVVNDSLYQYDWYRRLQATLNPDVPGIGVDFHELLQQNTDLRPIYFVEVLDTVPSVNQIPHNRVWRYVP